MKLTQNEGRGRAEDRHALRHQAGQGGLQPEPDLLEIRKLVNELPAIPGRMGAGALTGTALEKAEEAQVSIVVDPEVVTVAETYSWMFKDEVEAGPAVQAACGRLTSRLGKWRIVKSGLFAAQQLDRDLGDTDRWAGKEEQGMQAEFFRVLDGMLDGTIGNLAPAERDRLRAKAAPVLAIRAEARGEQQKERTLTLEAKEMAERSVSAAEAEAHMWQTARALRDDRPVEDGDLDGAIATFTALSESADETRSGRRTSRR